MAQCYSHVRRQVRSSCLRATPLTPSPPPPPHHHHNNCPTRHMWGVHAIHAQTLVSRARAQKCIYQLHSATRKIYVDNRLQSTCTSRNKNAVTDKSSFCVGSSNNGEYMTGRLRNVKIFKVALDPQTTTTKATTGTKGIGPGAWLSAGLQRRRHDLV